MPKLFLSILLISLFSLGLAQNKKGKKCSILPPEIATKQVKLGMSLADFKKTPYYSMVIDESMGFRTVCIGSVDDPQITDLIYYFDDEGDQPLYEIIVTYTDQYTASASAKNFLGSPNYDKNKEWRVKKCNFNVWAWLYQERLVLVGDLPNTEWSDEF